MQQVELTPIARRVSCLGFGCARLDGRSDRRRSARLLETALDLGISYFDVGASYGAGAAEEAVGQVIADEPSVVVATKHGPPLGAYDARRMRIKSLVRPVLDAVRPLKSLARRTVAPEATRRSPRPRYDFSPDAVRRSLEQSQRRLRRSRVDVLLAHEPHPDDLRSPEALAAFERLVAEGLVGAFGVGIGATDDRWAPFGSVWQCGWPGDRVASFATDGARLFHGVLRSGPRDDRGRPTRTPAELIRAARLAAPHAVLLVSASTPGRLRELVDAAKE